MGFVPASVKSLMTLSDAVDEVTVVQALAAAESMRLAVPCVERVFALVMTLATARAAGSLDRYRRRVYILMAVDHAHCRTSVATPTNKGVGSALASGWFAAICLFVSTRE